MPRFSRSFFHFAALGAVMAALALGGCGRKGGLDPPPGSSAQPPAADEKSGSGLVAPQSGDDRMVAPRGQKKKLPIDLLID